MHTVHSANDRILIVATATTMEMRAAFPHLARHIPQEHAWSVVQRPKKGDRRRSEAVPGQGNGGEPGGGPWGQLVLLVTGVGPLNAGISLGRLLGGLPHPSGVLNLGVAGAFTLERLPLGTAVVTREEIWPEFGLLRPSGPDPRGIGLALGTADGEPVWDRLRLEPQDNAKQMGLNLSGFPDVVGLTVAGVTGTPERASALQSRYACDIETMEGFALAWACRLAGVPFVQARTISNLVGSRMAEHWDLNRAKHHLAEVVTALLGTLKESHD